MARKRSAKDSSQKQSKTQKATANESMDVQDKWKADRDRVLALRQRDKDFLAETEKIKARLLELRKANPNLFKTLFTYSSRSGAGSYMAVFHPDEIARWMADAKDDDQKQILKEFWFYTARFRVWLRWDSKKAEFKNPSAFPPHATKYRARLVDGRLEEMEPAGNPWTDDSELPYESQYEDGNLSVPDPKVEQWMARGRAVLVRLEDAKGMSLLNDIERCFYDPTAITLIVHDSAIHYLFLLVGEMATVNDVRAAGKVLTALHKRFYGRKLAGKPKNIAKFVQRIEKVTAKDAKSQKEKAAELEPSAASRTAEVALSKTKKAIQPRPTR